jgi:hypothetical protein
VERNRKAGQNPPRVVAPIEEEEGDGLSICAVKRENVNIMQNIESVNKLI